MVVKESMDLDYIVYFSYYVFKYDKKTKGIFLIFV